MLPHIHVCFDGDVVLPGVTRDVYDYDEDYTAKNIANWITQTLADRVVKLTTQAHKTKVLDGTSHWHVLYTTSNFCESCETHEFRQRRAAYLLRHEAVKFGVVDCQRHAELCRKQYITSFPAVLLYVKGVSSRFHTAAG